MQENTKRRKQFRKYCSVCHTSSQLLSYHIFPKNPNRRKQWCNALKIDTELLKNKFVCSKHFKDSDYIPTALSRTSNRNLKKNVVPSLEIIKRATSTSRDIQNNLEVPDLQQCMDLVIQSPSYEQCNIQDNVDVPDRQQCVDLVIQSPSYGQCDTVLIVPEPVDVEDEKRPEYNFVTEEIKTEKCVTCTDYANILCENRKYELEDNRKNSIISEMERKILALNIRLNSIKNQQISHSMFVFEDESVKYYTGFVNYAAFSSVFDYILPSGNVKDIVNKNNEKVTHVCKLDAKDQFLLFLIKIRRDFDYKHISFLFDVSTATVSRIFQNWLYMSNFRLGNLNIWPHRNVLLANAPKKFKEQYPNVIGTIDCIELHIDSPSFLHRQAQSKSNYKRESSLKALIGLDPRGGITFISELYPGSISDVKLITDSGFVSIVKKKLQTREICAEDVILANNGFKVGDILKPVKLNLPDFKSAVIPFTDAEISNSRHIASARVHVEKVIRHMKTFKILKNIKISQCDNISQIWTVCALLCNFMYPAVTDNEEN